MDTYIERVLVGIRRIEDEVDRLSVHLNLDALDESLPVVLIQYAALFALVAVARVRRFRRVEGPCRPPGIVRWDRGMRVFVPELRIACYDGSGRAFLLASLDDTYRVEPVRYAN